MTTASGPLSPHNKRVTAARRLVKRGFRESDRAFLAEGPQAVREALAAVATRPGAVREVFVAADTRARHVALVEQAEAAGLPVHQVPGDVLAALSGTVTPQGIVAVCSFLDVPLATALAPDGRPAPNLVAVLVHVRDPGNAGTVVRSADAAGAGAVVLTDESVDPYNGKCVRASAGSLFHLPLVAGVPIGPAVAALRAAGLQILAADGAGADDLDDLADAGQLARPTAWLFGNEAWGLPAEVRELADVVVRVPIHGKAESLNLATAAAVCLYASAKALRRAPGVA